MIALRVLLISVIVDFIATFNNLQAQQPEPEFEYSISITFSKGTHRDKNGEISEIEIPQIGVGKLPISSAQPTTVTKTPFGIAGDPFAFLSYPSVQRELQLTAAQIQELLTKKEKAASVQASIRRPLRCQSQSIAIDRAANGAS